MHRLPNTLDPTHLEKLKTDHGPLDEHMERRIEMRAERDLSRGTQRRDEFGGPLATDASQAMQSSKLLE